MRREPDHLSRSDRIFDDGGRLLGIIYYSGAIETVEFREWFDEESASVTFDALPKEYNPAWSHGE